MYVHTGKRPESHGSLQKRTRQREPARAPTRNQFLFLMASTNTLTQGSSATRERGFLPNQGSLPVCARTKSEDSRTSVKKEQNKSMGRRDRKRVRENTDTSLDSKDDVVGTTEGWFYVLAEVHYRDWMR